MEKKSREGRMRVLVARYAVLFIFFKFQFAKFIFHKLTFSIIIHFLFYFIFYFLFFIDRLIDWLIMLLQLCQFSPLALFSLVTLFHQHFPYLSSCPWVMHISSLTSLVPILFLPSPCLFVPTNYASYSLYLFPCSPPFPPPHW